MTVLALRISIKDNVCLLTLVWLWQCLEFDSLQVASRRLADMSETDRAKQSSPVLQMQPLIRLSDYLRTLA